MVIVGPWQDSHSETNATLVLTKGIDASFDAFVKDKLEVLARLRPRLISDVQKLPGARILDGRFTAIQQGIGTPKARTATAAYLSAFVEEAKSSGLVAQTIARHAVRGVNVAPATAR